MGRGKLFGMAGIPTGVNWRGLLDLHFPMMVMLALMLAARPFSGLTDVDVRRSTAGLRVRSGPGVAVAHQPLSQEHLEGQN